MNKYLVLLGLCVVACEPNPPHGWDTAIAERWAHAAKLEPVAIVCTAQQWHTNAVCSINTGTQMVNLWCYYRATPYCLPYTR